VTSANRGISVRALTRYPELSRCVELQHEIWGPGFHEAAPASLLWAAQRTGGIIAGAFDERDDMLGFVFGISGYRDGEPLHWSDMLGVRSDVRGTGVGRLLKAWQRTTLLAAGIRHVGWTFDPLESRNAWLNFSRLGITAREYVVDCYGNSASPLHAGLGTDRLVARWVLDSPRVRSRMEEGAEPPPTPEPVFINGPEGDVEPDFSLAGPALRLRIPARIQDLKAADPGAAARWREWTRAAFSHYLARGYGTMELVRDSAEWSSYLLVRDVQD
jgi:predicted GNAT superfamily acetyltransferase